MKWSQIPLYLAAVASAAKLPRDTSARARARARARDDTDCTGIGGVSPKCESQESGSRRDVFYVGGNYVPSGDSYLMSGQLYVEKLTPIEGVTQAYPLVFMTAGSPAGNIFLNTPDNRKGWASYFVDQGYQVYLVEVAAVGRSRQSDLDEFPLNAVPNVMVDEMLYTSPEKSMAYSQAAGHDQWPGSGVKDDPIFDAFYATALPWTTNPRAVELAMRASGCRLLELIGVSFIVSHSDATTYGTLITDECPDLVAATINLEPSNLPFAYPEANMSGGDGKRIITTPWGLTITPLAYDPPVVDDVAKELVPVEVGTDSPDHRSCFLQSTDNQEARKLTNLAKVPYVMFTSSASILTTFAHCFPLFLNQAGVDVTWVKFEDKGLKGNGHLFFVEKNNMDLAKVVEAEIARLSEDRLAPSRAAVEKLA